MIALLALYAVAVGAACAAAAWLAERALTVLGRPARWAWAAALGLTVALPAAAVVGALREAAPVDAVRARLVVVAADPGAATAPAGRRPPIARALPATLSAPAGWARLDLPLAALWAAAAVSGALQLAVAARRGRRAVRRWPRREVLGTAVRVSSDVGPAVAGALRPEIVVPAWALGDGRLGVMLAHERAHLRAGDPLLLAAAHAAAAVMPWNPAVRWQLRRLRAAVEVDCDRRVLGTRAVDVRAYGALLLDVAARPTSPLPVLSLTAPSTLLRRRIDAMTARRPAHALLRAAAPASLAAAVVALACEAPRPTAPRPMARVPLTQIAPGADAPASESGLLERDVRAAIAERAPELLRTAEGRTQRVWVVQEADGRVSRLVRDTAAAAPATVRLRGVRVGGAGPALAVRTGPGAGGGVMDGIDPARVAAVDVLRLAPGRVGPDSLNVIWLRLRPAGAPDAAPGGARACRPARPGAARGCAWRSGPTACRPPRPRPGRCTWSTGARWKRARPATACAPRSPACRRART
jgi:beta-lactamase regulating signal transducer with metallopeptidase domain